jgi:hypothetical protein
MVMSKRLPFLLAGVLTSALVAAGCGSSETPSSGSAPSAPVKNDQVVVAAAAVDAGLAQLWVAQAAGLFAKQHLDVKIIVAGATSATEVVSGHADLADIGPAGALAAAQKGAQTSIIYYNTNGSLAGLVAAKSDVTSLSQCKRMGSLGEGSTLMANVVMYQAAAKTNYDIVPFADNPTVVASLMSGSVTCAVGSWNIFGPQLTSHKLHLIVDPSDPATIPAGTPPGSHLVGGVLWGMKPNLSARRDVIVRFMRAYQQAVPMIRKYPVDKLAGMLKQSKDWAGVPADTVAKALDAERSAMVPSDPPGYIAPSIWADALSYFKAGGLPGSTTDAAYSYANRVDMSFYKAAVG